MPRKRLLIYFLIVVVAFAGAYTVRVFTYRPVCRDIYQRVSPHVTGELEMEKVRDAPGYIDFSVTSVDIKQWEKNSRCSGTITMEITAPEDIALKLSLQVFQSTDNLGTSTSKIVELKADVPQTFVLNYQGWESGFYWVDIYARASRKFHPEKENELYAYIKLQMYESN